MYLSCHLHNRCLEKRSKIDTLFKEFSDFTHPLLEGKLSKVLKSFIFKTVLCCELFHQEE